MNEPMILFRLIRNFLTIYLPRQKDATLTIYYQELLNIPKKKQSKRHDIEFFSENALQIILDQPDTTNRYGIRNLMFMILLYDTGA